MKYIVLILATLTINEIILAQQTKYIFDHANHLKHVIYPNQTISYNYDADGNRISIARALPVQLASFVATKGKNQVLLTWEVIQEINFAKYDVQFSINGISFQTFASVIAKGSSIKVGYNTIHCCPILGDNYYRLKMIDKDGKFTYSEIRKVTFDDDNSFRIYPNPVSNKTNLTISFEKPLASDPEIYVYNVIGNKVMATSLVKGQTTYDLKLPVVAAGTYFIVINTKDKLYQSKFIKQ